MVQFIQRPDFELRIQESEHPAALLYNRASVKHMISRIKRDSATFERYQHNRDLVALLNAFACHDRDLPPAWESRLDDNGKVSIFFLLPVWTGCKQIAVCLHFSPKTGGNRLHFHV